MKLWEGLEQDLNYNAMVSQRGVLNLFHSDPQRDAYARRGNAMRLHGVDAELLDREQVRALVPFLDFDNARFPIQRRAAAAARRHGAARRGRLGLCPRGGPARRRHHPELRGRPASASRTGACSASRPRRASSAPTRWRWPAPATRRASRRWPACGCRSRAIVLQAFVTEGVKPRDRRGHDLRRRAFLCQPVRQGRAGLRRRYRRLQFLRPARQSAGDRGRVRRRHGADAGDRAPAHPAHMGRAAWT